MPDSSLPLDAFVLIDNNAVVGLCDFFCDRHHTLPFTKMVPAVCDEIANTFERLRRFAQGGKIFTTTCVHDEFKPEKSDLAKRKDFDHDQCGALKSSIKSQVEPLDIKMPAIQTLRKMAETPKKFGESLSRLSDPDLSLVILALGLINAKNQRVYILTDEEDLRSFISWAKARPEVKAICPNSHLLEALHSMIYMDNAHRRCAFTTEQIYEIFVHYQQLQLKRKALDGTTKFEMIELTFSQIKEAIRSSGQIKKANLEGVA